MTKLYLIRHAEAEGNLYRIAQGQYNSILTDLGQQQYVIYHAYDAESVEIGWVLFPESWGRGYASALTDLLIGRARREQKDVVLECVPAQEATKRIAVKKGFHDCGISDGLAVYRLCGKNQNAGSS